MKICNTCNGTGQTRECATIVKQVKPKIWKTIQLGSGCLMCKGLGITGTRNVHVPIGERT